MAKSIVEIEIQDGQWKKFSEQVKQYREELKEMPGQWGAIGKSLAKTQSIGAKFVASIKEGSNQIKSANSMAGKMTLALKASDRVMTSLGRGTLAVARNLKDATKSLLSWGSVMGLISGVLGAGGLFGIARLAGAVSSGQSNAMRTGSTYGGAKAAGISYGQALGGEGGVQSLLETFAKEKESGGVAFRRLGMGEEQWQGKAPSDILGPFLKAVQTAYQTAPKGAESKVMETLAPELDFNTIKQLSHTNIDELQKSYESNKRMLELSKGTQDAYANFSRTLDAAKEKIENVFVKALTPLLPGLTKLSEAFAKAAATIMQSPLIKNLISGGGKALERGANYLTSEEFSNDFRNFLEEMQKIGKAMSDTADFLSRWLGDGSKGAEKVKTLESTPQIKKAYDEAFSYTPRSPAQSMPKHAGSNIKVDVTVHAVPGSSPATSAWAAQ